uniref:39S ribosomal protein L41, mitochondrial (inferred by orthology to a C. elegans protein) n=1 Tax=Strongyloides venezuelensis TaxID=75913 RepID=A0A0K0G0N5_STRVS
MASLIPYISTRGVRSLNPFHFNAPYLFVKKGSRGQRKIGPTYYEKSQWPGQMREFPELSPKFMKLNPKELQNYTDVHPIGYHDETTGGFVVVKEMIPELVVPDLTDFELKPYVSYKTDAVIEENRKKFLNKVKELGSQELADLNTPEDERWPPPAMKSKTLFDLYYADEVKKNYLEGKYDNKS